MLSSTINVSLNGVDEYNTRGLYFPDNVLRLYRETPTSENMQWQLKIGEYPGKCKQNKPQIRKTKRTNVIKNSNLNTAF